MSQNDSLTKANSFQLLVVIIFAVALVMAIVLPIKQLVEEQIEQDFKSYEQDIVSQFQAARIDGLPHLTQLLSTDEIYAALGQNNVLPLKQALLSYSPIKGRLNQGYWIKGIGSEIKPLFDAMPTYDIAQEDLLQSFQLPAEKSLVGISYSNNKQLRLSYITRLRHNGNADLGIIALVFDVSDVVSHLSIVLEENSPFGFALVDRYDNVVVTVGNSGLRAMTRDALLSTLHQITDHDGFLFDNGAWYSKTLTPLNFVDDHIYERTEWRLLIQLNSAELWQRYWDVLALPLIALLIIVLALVWFVMTGRWQPNGQHAEARLAGQYKVLPEKVYDWAFQLEGEKNVVAGNLLLSLGYEFKHVNLNNNALLHAIVSDEDIARLTAIGKDILHGTDQRFDIDLRLRHRLGFWVWFNVKGQVASTNQKNRVTSLEGICIEITKRKQDEKALFLALESTERASKMKSHFILNLSREVRTPINAILSYLQQSNHDNAPTDFVNQSREALNTLLARFHQMIVYLQLEQDTLEMNEQEEHLALFVDSVIAHAEQPLFGACQFQSSVDASLAESYFFDADKLKLLMQLLIQAMGMLGEMRQINIAVENQSRSKHTHTLKFNLKLNCHDNIADTALMLFNDQNESTRDQMGGAAIDLALAHKLAERLGTDIDAEQIDTGIHLSFLLDLALPSGAQIKKMPSNDASDDAEVPSPTKVENALSNDPEYTDLDSMPSNDSSAKQIPSGIDIPKTLQRVAGNKDIVLRVLERFLSDFSGWQHAFNDLISEQHWQEAKLQAHTLKGAAINIDAARLSALAADMEAMMKKSEILDQDVRRLQFFLQQEHKLVDQAIRDYLDLHSEENATRSTLDNDAVLETLASFEALLAKKKRLPQNDLETVKQALANTECAPQFVTFVEACHRFDFEAAQNTLEAIKIAYKAASSKM